MRYPSRALSVFSALFCLSFSLASQAGEVTIRFPLELWNDVQPSAELRAGDQVTIDYERMRFKEIVDRKLQAERGGTSYVPGWTYASGFHCYGYGCCTYHVPNVEMYARFRANDAFERYDISPAGGKPVLTVPVGAQQLELYFRIERFDVTVYYCGGGPTNAPGSGGSLNVEAYDSVFGANYRFKVR